MTEVYVLVLLKPDGTIAEIISAHPTKSAADSAERFYRSYTLPAFDKPDTDIITAPFETW
jgi:hypothetical protein